MKITKTAAECDCRTVLVTRVNNKTSSVYGILFRLRCTTAIGAHSHLEYETFRLLIVWMYRTCVSLILNQPANLHTRTSFQC
jgi:hypothetical protein